MDIVDISIPVEADVAGVLAEEKTRAEVGRFVTQMLRARTVTDPLRDIMDRMSAEAARRGLTQEMLDEELTAYNAERRTSD